MEDSEADRPRPRGLAGSLLSSPGRGDPCGDMAYLKQEMRFAAIANRFDWERAALDEAGAYQRRHAGLRFERVMAARIQGIDLKRQDAALALLALTFEPAEEPSGRDHPAFCRRRRDPARGRVHRSRAARPRRRLARPLKARARERRLNDNTSMETAARPIARCPSACRRAIPASRRRSPPSSATSARSPTTSTPPSRAIIADVRARGDAALIELSQKFDRVDLAQARHCASRAAEIDAPRRPAAPRRWPRWSSPRDRIAEHHDRQLPTDDRYRDALGVELGSAGRRSSRSASTCRAGSPPIRARC